MRLENGDSETIDPDDTSSLSSRIESIKSWFNKTAMEDLEDTIPRSDRIASYAIIGFCVLLALVFGAHHARPTGFYTGSFGVVGGIFLYGSLSYWIITSVVLLLGYKDPSRDLDSWGGLHFVCVALVWFIVVFPFDFAHFPDALPGFLQFLVKWISDGVALGLMVLALIVHLAFAVTATTVRVLVFRERARRDL